MGKPSNGGWKASLAAVLKEHNRTKQDGSVASHGTQDKRAHILYAGFKALREKGYKLDDVRSFRGKHMEVLAALWEGSAGRSSLKPVPTGFSSRQGTTLPFGRPAPSPLNSKSALLVRR